MARWYLVDGYNYLYRTHRLPSGRLLEAVRRGLGERLAALVRGEDRVRIVWDSARLDVPVLSVETYAGGVRGEFPRGQSADERIIEILEHARDPGRYVVVTDDNRVRRCAGRRGARTATVHEIERRLCARGEAGSDKPAAALSPEEVEAWRRLFEDGASGPR